MTTPEGLTLTPSNHRLDSAAVQWVKVELSYPCSDCIARGGWLPRVWQSDCPECYGEDPYGDGSYCGQCQFCCGC